MTQELDNEIKRKEQSMEDEDDFSESPPTDIVAFNELRSCADLVRMYKANQLIIKPDFQRDVVWNKPAQTRFIDSLVKQLPIPSMCLSLDYNTGERLMIDGLQRISSIIYFLTDDNWRLSKLDDIDTRITGRTPGHLKDKHYNIYSRVENLTIPITVLRCDYAKKSHMHYLFTIFHRLNTGGNKLSNQEIRNCIFHGEFNDLIKSLVQSDTFRSIFSLEEDKSYRFSYEELVLRIFAFSDRYEKYNGKLAKYLNDYMEGYRKITEGELASKNKLMQRALKLIYSTMLDGGALPKLSKATTEAIFVGVIRNIDALEDESTVDLNNRLITLREDNLFSLDSLKEGLSATSRVKDRMNKAVEIFR